MNRHRLEPGANLRLAEMPTDGADFHPDRDAAEVEFSELRKELIDWQVRLYAEGKHKLLVVLQAMDAGGKDGTIRKVFAGVNPQGVHVQSFKEPSHRELAHDYLWRIHQAVPAKGMLGVFNRSHYEDVLVVRVENLISADECRRRYDHINAFERMLTETGTTILKFFLHISPAEQRERLQARLDDPSKHWKFAMSDLEKRKHFPAYMRAYEDVLMHCTTVEAPWHVIPANQKWYRNLAVIRAIVDALRSLDPQFPTAQPGLEDVQLE